MIQTTQDARTTQRTVDYIINQDDIKEKFWDNNYVISVTSQSITFLVNAEHEGAAFDEVMNYIVDKNLTGLYTKEEPEFSDYIRAGNCGYWFSTYNIAIKEVS